MEHGVGKSGVSKCNVALEAEGAIYANFTTGIETGGSFMASGHLKLTEGTRAESVNSAGVGSPVCVTPHIGVGSMVATAGCHS